MVEHKCHKKATDRALWGDLCGLIWADDDEMSQKIVINKDFLKTINITVSTLTYPHIHTILVTFHNGMINSPSITQKFHRT